MKTPSDYPSTVFYQCCGWYFWYLDEHDALQERGPWFTAEEAAKKRNQACAQVGRLKSTKVPLH